MTPKRLYLLLAAACAAGYLYLAYSAGGGADGTGPGPCMFKNVTGIPCPSCGSTRSVLALMEGDVGAALRLNPLGLLLAAGLLAVPIWIPVDLLTGKRSLPRAWQRFEHAVRIPWVAAAMIALIALNWIWNIYKDV